MYVPRAFLFAIGCLFFWRILARVFNCQSRIGRKVALPGILVGCRKQNDGGTRVCDLCSFYGGAADVLFGGATLVLAAIAVWQWFKI
jgi:hypothetical protein